MTLPSRMFNGVKYFRRPQVYHSRKDANDAKKWWEEEGYKVEALKSGQKVGKMYDYRLYTSKKMDAEELENIVCVRCECRETCRLYCGAFRYIIENDALDSK